jgi:hypothetical protein
LEGSFGRVFFKKLRKTPNSVTGLITAHVKMAETNAETAAMPNAEPVSAMSLLKQRQARSMDDDSAKVPREENMSYDLGR